jgi:inorganic triphosphatase YgiF
MSEPLERELKLVPRDVTVLDRLTRVERLGSFAATSRHRELQRNTFFDSSSRELARARVGFRRRTIEGQSLATWTIKADDDRPSARGIASRAEIELQLDADMAPALALGALRHAARQRGAGALAEVVDDALAAGGLPTATPVLETETERVVVDLEATERGWAVELALDRVRLLGHAYEEVEIEAELKRGDEVALDAIREAIAAVGPVAESHGSKLSRALEHAASCDCRTPPRTDR